MSSEAGFPPGTATRPSSIRRHRRKLAALLIWLALLCGYQFYAWQSGLTPPEAAQRMIDLMTGEAGWAIYVAFYALSRPIFFPPTLLTIGAGFVFGPVTGVVLAVMGSNAGALISYLMGRSFGRGLLDPGGTPGVARRSAERMRKNGFESVLLLRLVWAPFDPVSLLAGFLRIDLRRFVLATALGSLPCILSLVLLGASIETDFADATLEIKPWALLASAALFAASLFVSRHVRSRPAAKNVAG